MASLRILVADDHEIVRRVIGALLGLHPGGEICGEAADGREALEKVAQLRPDIVLLDIDMPIMNGGNPDTRVWIDLHTALYYCPGADVTVRRVKVSSPASATLNWTTSSRLLVKPATNLFHAFFSPIEYNATRDLHRPEKQERQD